MVKSVTMVKKVKAWWDNRSMVKIETLKMKSQEVDSYLNILYEIQYNHYIIVKNYTWYNNMITI